MKTKRELLNELKKEIEDLHFAITNTKAYNKKVRQKNMLYNMLLFFNRAFPYILSLVITINLNMFKKNSPFLIDEVADYISFEELYTSTGGVKRKTSFDIDYNSEIFEYSTGWTLDEYDLYEKVTTYYRYSEIKDLDINKILDMSLEELNQMFTIIDMKVEKKKTLTEEEQKEQPMIKINVFGKGEEFTMRDETIWGFIGRLVLCFAMFMSCGFGLSYSEKKFLKDKINEFLKKKIEQSKGYKSDEVKDLVQIFKIKLANYEILTSKEEAEAILSRGIK